MAVIPDYDGTGTRGFVYANLQTLSTPLWEEFFTPGDGFNLLYGNAKEDGSEATPAEVANALARWDLLTDEQGWGIWMFHNATIKWPHDSDDRKFLFFDVSIPDGVLNLIANSASIHATYLGEIWSVAALALQGLPGPVTVNDFTDGTMDTVVQGHEDAAL